MMKAIQKFTTFDELKYCELKKLDFPSRLKKHKALEKVIKEIKSVNFPKKA